MSGVISSKKTKLRPVPANAVEMRDGFWKRRMDLNHEFGIPKLLSHLEEHGVVDNFMLVSGRKQVERKGPYFSDSDIYKWIEGAAWDVMVYGDGKTSDDLERVIDEVVAAQGDDGYLNTFFQGELFSQRFRDLPVEHELYCAGHLFQAAVAHYRATGSEKLLSAACGYADYLAQEFGPGKREQVDGHPEIEMALVELYRVTGEQRYLDLAGYFLSLLKFPDMQGLAGHAVRALYTCCGGADYAVESGDATFEEAGLRLWEDLVSTKMYVTGGVGSRYQKEAIGEAYELPNLRAYTETCAAIASVMWNLRMLSIYGDAKYAVELERALYNGVISGISLDGTAYFYRNPLSDRGGHTRQEWWGCTCCPTNMVRTLASLPSYMYATSDEGVWVHLLDNSKLSYKLADGTPFSLEVSTKYPWDGNVDITVGLDAPKEFTLFVRKPAGCPSVSSVAVSGQKTSPPTGESGYWAFRREWQPGDQVSIRSHPNMPVLLMECDPRVRENYGSVAVQRGPLVYCAESHDNPGVSIIDLELASDTLEHEWEENLLGGVMVVKGEGLTPLDPQAGRGPLYRPRRSTLPSRLEHTPVRLIPYYAWANRGPADMTVWMPFRQDPASANTDRQRKMLEHTKVR